MLQINNKAGKVSPLQPNHTSHELSRFVHPCKPLDHITKVKWHIFPPLAVCLKEEVKNFNFNCNGGLAEQGLVNLARNVGCRRVVFVPNWRHSVSCRRIVADIFQSCRRHKKMSCRLECLTDTTFDDMSGNSRHVGLLFEFKHKNSMVG